MHKIHILLYNNINYATYEMALYIRSCQKMTFQSICVQYHLWFPIHDDMKTNFTLLGW